MCVGGGVNLILRFVGFDSGFGKCSRVSIFAELELYVVVLAGVEGCYWLFCMSGRSESVW